jgi:hypothetical protein
MALEMAFFARNQLSRPRGVVRRTRPAAQPASGSPALARLDLDDQLATVQVHRSIDERLERVTAVEERLDEHGASANGGRRALARNFGRRRVDDSVVERRTEQGTGNKAQRTDNGRHRKGNDIAERRLNAVEQVRQVLPASRRPIR